jgi:RNA polymerase sigma-70 factor (ECF subfamily)
VPPDVLDPTLVTRAQQGDGAAFERLVENYQALVSAYTRQLLEDVPEAEDVAQDVFLKAFEELQTLRDPARFGGWLKTIAWRECRAWVRARQSRRRVLKSAEEDARSFIPDPFLEEAESADSEPWLDRLAQTIDDLSEGKKAVLALFYVRGLSHETIADFLEIPVGTVKRRLFEARQAVAGAATEELDAAERRRFVAAVRQLLESHAKRKDLNP